MKNATRLLAIALLLVAACGKRHDGGATGVTPTPTPDNTSVAVSVSPNPANKLQTVTVDASQSTGSFTSFDFDFGDGSAIVSQASPLATHAYDVVNHADTNYVVKVTGHNGTGTHLGQANLLVKDLPPAVTSVDEGNDKAAVIGEWIKVAGHNFFDAPAITVDGQTATHVEVIDTENLRFRVPPKSRAGLRDVFFTWDGYDPQKSTLDVKRFAVSTSARYAKVYVMDVASDEAVTDTGTRIPLTDASMVKVSPDGSTAYVTNGRFNPVPNGTITIIDLTSNGGPAIAGTLDAGQGPLYAIAPAANAPMLVCGDAFGIYTYDISDPQHPALRDYASALFSGDPANDVAAADIAVTPDGSQVVVLNALDAQARIFSVGPDMHFTNPTSPVRVDVGPKTQKAAISEDGTILYVLGGGGEGAVPMDLSDPKAANLTAVSLASANLGAILAGPYKLSDMNGGNAIAPVPFDLAISKANPHRVYVTTLDQGFTTLFDDLGTFFNDPSLANLVTIVNFLAQGGLNFGDTLPVLSADATSHALGSPMQSNFTAPTSADLLYDDHKMLQTTFSLQYDDNTGNIVFATGATVIDTTSHASTAIPFESEELSLDAVFGLFQPPFSFGDVAFQP